MPGWLIYEGKGKPHKDIKRLPIPPRWRRFSGDPVEKAR